MAYHISISNASILYKTEVHNVIFDEVIESMDRRLRNCTADCEDFTIRTQEIYLLKNLTVLHVLFKANVDKKMI